MQRCGILSFECAAAAAAAAAGLITESSYRRNFARHGRKPRKPSSDAGSDGSDEKCAKHDGAAAVSGDHPLAVAVDGAVARVAVHGELRHSRWCLCRNSSGSHRVQ